MSSRHAGFTLLELILILGVIAMIAMIVIVTINPTKQLSEHRNIQRKVDTTAIMTAYSAYLFDHQNRQPTEIPARETGICRSLPGSDCSNLINLSALTGALLPMLPVDPLETNEDATGYTIVTTKNHIIIRAPRAEKGESIEVIR